MKYFSRFTLFIFAVILIYGSGINYYEQIGSEIQGNQNFHSHFSFSESKPQLYAVQFQGQNLVELVNVYSIHNLKVQSKFDFIDCRTPQFKSINSLLYSNLNTVRLITGLLTRKIIFPFHFFW